MALSSERIANIMTEHGLETPRVAQPPCVVGSEDVLGDFVAWFLGEVALWHLPLTEMEISEVLWWQEANAAKCGACAGAPMPRSSPTPRVGSVWRAFTPK